MLKKVLLPNLFRAHMESSSQGYQIIIREMSCYFGGAKSRRSHPKGSMDPLRSSNHCQIAGVPEGGGSELPQAASDHK